MGNLGNLEVRPRLTGLKALAEGLGVTPSHLSRVWRGERRSPRLEAALAAAGCPARRQGRGGRRARG